jgi:tetratricopeptide (TPR) repeat protein
MAFLDLMYAYAGRHAEALALIEQMQPDEPAISQTALAAHWLLPMGEVYLLVGRATEASECATEALTLAGERKERGHEAWALRLLGEIAPPASSDVGTAGGRYKEAMALAGELDMRPLVAHCHLGLGKLARRTGNREEAQEHLTTATTMYREMDMRFWLEQAEAEMASDRRIVSQTDGP